MIVLDASVLAKLFLNEPLSDLAESLLERHPLIVAPELARLEVASAILRRARSGVLARQEAEEKLKDWQELVQLGNFRLISNATLQPQAEMISLELKHPLADCLYLAAAERESLPLITADAPFIEALQGRYINVRHLASLGN